MKICKTCRYWSTEKKGFCYHDNRAVGQFWHCEDWQAPEQEIARTRMETPCQACATQTR